MDVNFIFRIAAIGIIVAVLNQLLVRSGREEQAMMTTTRNTRFLSVWALGLFCSG